ncbi:putative RNA-binding protein EEED8.10 [Leptopilina boulardi]|uniref:putative RNA-binding protein EEED8.10 n=1 Tax=Leptopilina boulardi TaxID=63433 RepID=UPI0021F6487A|nr:putative RNA-binding protein EEED8.10 [Leptopilina boulardi]
MNNSQDCFKISESIKHEPYLYTRKNGIAIRKLVVSNLSSETQERDIKFLFSKYGQIDKCLLRQDCKSNCTRCFITFNTAEDALQARKAGYENFIQLNNRTLTVEPAYSWLQTDKKRINLKRKRENIAEPDEEPPIKKLNEDCLIRIFEYLPITDRLRIERVSKQFRSASYKSWSKIKYLKNSSFKSDNTTRSIIAFNKILQRCGRYVTRVRLNSNNSEYNEESLRILPIYCQKLHSIYATSLSSSTALKILALRCQNITKIELSLENCFEDSDDDFALLFSLNRKLKYIDICYGYMTGNCLLQLSPESIQSIVLDKCLASADYLIKAVKNFKKLYELDLTDCDISGLLPALKNCANTLNTLFFQDCILRNKNEADCIKFFVNLQQLWLVTNQWITDNFFYHVGQNCHKISSVCIIGLNEITDIGIENIALLPKLEWLNIKLSITGSGLEKMFNLKYLEINSEGSLTVEALCKVLRGAKKLETLKINEEMYTRNDFKLIKIAIEVSEKRENNLPLRFIFQTPSEREKIEHLNGISPNLFFDLIMLFAIFISYLNFTYMRYR